MIHLDDVWKSFAGAPALRGVSLSVADGDALLLTGPSGAGKTTLLRLIFAAEKADRGDLLINGHSLGKLRASSIPYVRRNIGVVFQDFKLIENWAVWENVSLPLEVLGVPQRIIRTRVGEVLERVGLGGRGGDPAGRLSGGEQQRVAIARAIVCEPALVLADEPTGNLDPQLAIDILGLFEDINETGVTVLFATHDRSLLDIRPRRVIVLDDGKAMDVPNGLGNAADLIGHVA